MVKKKEEIVFVSYRSNYLDVDPEVTKELGLKNGDRTNDILKIVEGNLESVKKKLNNTKNKPAS